MAEDRIPSLDGLRAVSVALVIGGHLRYAHPELDAFGPVSEALNGDVGVRVFFVISGFLITGILLREADHRGGVDLQKFYLRRIFRLFPVYYAFILFLFLLTLATPLKLSACRYITAVAFVKNYGCGEWVDGHLWSLSVEEQFYLIWPPALVLLGIDRARRFAVILICLAPFSRAIEYLHGSRSFAWLSSNADVLMIGCLLAVYAHRHRAQLERLAAWHPAPARLVAGLLVYLPAFLGARLLLGRFSVMLGPTLQALSVAFLIGSLTYNRSGLAYKFLNLPAVTYVGVISYSLYIWQMPFLARADSYGGKSEWFLRFPVNLILIFGLAILSYHLLEQPFVNLRRRLHAHQAVQADPTRCVAP